MSYQLITDGFVISQGPNILSGLPTTFELESGDGDSTIQVYVSPVNSIMWIKISGVWKQTTPFIKVSGVWKQATPYIKNGGIWK
jgi:hypothetical protein